MRFLKYCILILLLTSCGKKAEKETLYIPQNYIGPIAVVFDQKNGAAAEYKEDRRIYRIPNRGLLYTQLPDVKGILNRKFYYVDRTGKVIEEITSIFLPILPTAKYDSSRIYVMDGFDGGFKISPEATNVEYIYLCVGQANQSDSLSDAGYKLLERVKEIYPEQLGNK